MSYARSVLGVNFFGTSFLAFTFFLTMTFFFLAATFRFFGAAFFLVVVVFFLVAARVVVFFLAAVLVVAEDFLATGFFFAAVLVFVVVAAGDLTWAETEKARSGPGRTSATRVLWIRPRASKRVEIRGETLIETVERARRLRTAEDTIVALGSNSQQIRLLDPKSVQKITKPE